MRGTDIHDIQDLTRTGQIPTQAPAADRRRPEPDRLSDDRAAAARLRRR